MNNKQNVMVFVEQNGGVFADVSLELLCKARQLADKLGVLVEVTVLGCDLELELDKLGKYGCDKVYYFEDKKYENYSSVPFAKTVVHSIRLHKPQIVLFGATINGRDLSPRVASELKCGLTADCTELEIGDFKYQGKMYTDSFLQMRPAFGGNIVATIVSPESDPSMATVREGVMKRLETKGRQQMVVEKSDCPIGTQDVLSEIISIIREKKAVNLKASPVVVAAGMGAGNNSGINLIKMLAKTLGAEVGATRPMVDSGFFPLERQIGQTGLTVRPNLYIACGISGQIQHSAGMSESSRIIAINSDAEAPIFSYAHFGIVGDLHAVIPEMIRAYKEKT